MNEKSAADKKCIVSITHIGQCGPIYLHALNSFRVHLIEIKRMCSPNGLRVSECVCVWICCARNPLSKWCVSMLPNAVPHTKINRPIKQKRDWLFHITFDRNSTNAFKLYAINSVCSRSFQWMKTLFKIGPAPLLPKFQFSHQSVGRRERKKNTR